MCTYLTMSTPNALWEHLLDSIDATATPDELLLHIVLLIVHPHELKEIVDLAVTGYWAGNFTRWHKRAQLTRLQRRVLCAMYDPRYLPFVALRRSACPL